MKQRALAFRFRSLGVRWFALLVATAALEAQSVRLNGPLAQPGAGDVLGYEIDAAGERVVYRADQDADDVFELFSAPADGSAPAVRLNGTLAPDRDVGAFALAAGERVVYVSDEAANDIFELYSVPIDGSTGPVLLSGALVAGGDVEVFQLTPDLTRAVFRANKLASVRSELFAVPVDGSAAPVRLDPLNREAAAFSVAPDGALVLYVTPDGSTERLHRVPIDASQLPVQLADSGPIPSEWFYTAFLGFEIDPAGEHAVYRTILQELDGGYELDLFTVALDGSTPPAQLNATSTTELTFEPAGERVIYRSSQQLYSIRADGTDRTLIGNAVLYTVAPDGSRVVFTSAGTLYSAPADASQAPLALAGPGTLTGIAVSPSSTLVLFTAVEPVTSFLGLWAVPITGGAPLLVNGPAVPGGRGVAGFEFAPGGPRIVYREDREQDEVFELYSVDTALDPVKLSGPLGGSRDVTSFRISGDGQRVAYLADQTNDETFEVFGTPIDGALPAVQYNEPLPAGPVQGDVLAFRPSPAETEVVYRADQDANDAFDLYAVGLDAPGETVRLTSPLTETGDVVGEVVFAPDAERIVFQVDGARFYHLYSVPAAGGEAPVEIDHFDTQFPFPFAVTADGARVVYRRRTFTFGDFDLCSAPLEGGPVVTLAAPQGARTVAEFQLDPDGTTAVYRADQAHDTVIELYRVPVDGSAAPVKLNLALSGERDVDAFEITADGAHVVYLADQALDNRVELWSAPLATSERPERLNGLLPPFGDVTDFRLTPDGGWVVFRADAAVDGTFELFRARVAGRRPPAHGPAGSFAGDLVRLTTLLSGHSVERDVALAPDGGDVFFRADALAGDVLELFRTPADGSGPLTRLSADPVAGGDVTAFAVAPDGSHVVYLADARTDGVIEIFGVPSSGGAVVAYDTLPAFADVISFQIAPDAGHVGWLVDRNANGVPELFLAPLDGSAPAHRVNDPLPAGGEVHEDYTVLSAGRALYRADQESDEVFELFLGSFAPLERTAQLLAPRARRGR